MIRQTRDINDKTGEILKEKCSKIELFNEEGYLFNAQKNYSRVFNDVDYPKALSINDLGRLLLIQKHVQKSTNLFYKKTNRGTRAMSSDEIIKAARLKSRQGHTFFKKMLDNDVIGRVDTTINAVQSTQYYANPLYLHNSKRISYILYSIFKKSLDPHLAAWVKDEFAQIQNDIDGPQAGD